MKQIDKAEMQKSQTTERVSKSNAFIAAFGKITVSSQSYYTTTSRFIEHLVPISLPFSLRIAPSIAETPLHLCVKNEPLSVVLELLASLFSGRWCEEQTGDGSLKTAYALEPKPITIEREKALYTATLDLSAEPLVQFARMATRHGLAYWQKEYQKGQTVPATQGEPTPEKQQLQLLASPDGNGYAFCSLLAGLTRAQQRALINSGYLYVPWSAMNAAQRQSALATRHLAFRIAPNSADDMTPEQNRAAEQKERAAVQQFGMVLSVDKAPVSGQVVTCRLSPGTHEGRREMRLPDVKNPFLLPVRGNPYVFDPTAGSVPNAPRGDNGTANAEGALLEKVPFPSGVTFMRTDTWADVLQKLSNKLPFVVLSDAYTAARLCKFPPYKDLFGEVNDLSDKSVAQALDVLCTAYHYLWWYEPGKKDTPGTLLFRSRAWFIEKRYETPAGVDAKSNAALHGSGKRWENVAVVDSVAGLTIEQLQGVAGRAIALPGAEKPDLPRFILHSFMAGTGRNSACAAFHSLRFWSHLSPAQKQAMMSESGLPGNALSDEQKKELLQNLFVSASLQAPPQDAETRWEKARLHVHYQESQPEDAPPQFPLQWKPNEVHAVWLSFSGGGIGYGGIVVLPVALAPPPQPKKKPAVLPVP